MKRLNPLTGLSVVALGLGMSAVAQAATYTIGAGSAMTDFRRIGVSLADAANTTSDPSTWDIVDGDQTTAAYDAFAPVFIGGSITVTGGVVTAATLIQQSTFQIGSYQSPTSQANMVVNNITWTFNSATNQLTHAATPGAASCVLVNGATTTPGGCSGPATAVNNGTIASILYFDGIGANYTVTDAVVNPLTNTGGTLQQVNLGGGTAKLGITWDLSQLGSGVITGLAIANQPSGFNPSFNGATAATFSIQVVPVPGAVWLFGSALAVVAGLRRKIAC